MFRGLKKEKPLDHSISQDILAELPVWTHAQHLGLQQVFTNFRNLRLGQRLGTAAEAPA